MHEHPDRADEPPDRPDGDDPARSDRAQTSGPPAEPLPSPESRSDAEREAIVEDARRRDPTAETGQAG